MFRITYLTHLILALGITASKSLPQKGTPSRGCELKANTLIVEGSIKVSCAAECQKKCQKDDCCQFFTYNKASKSCGLRNFVPQARSFSLGNISGLKNESPLIWTKVSNSVYVAKSFKTNTAADCQTICLADNECKAMIYNKLLGQCSLNLGEGPYREIPLGDQSRFGISSCIKQGGSGSGVNKLDSILIAGRLSGKELFAESEALLAEDCTIPDLPEPVEGNTLVMTIGIGGAKKILSCGGFSLRRNNTCILEGPPGERYCTFRRECHALNKDVNGNAKWTLYNKFSEFLTYNDLHSITPASVFLPKNGTYIFGYLRSQFLPIGTNVWKKGPSASETGESCEKCPGGRPNFNGVCAVAINDEEFLLMGNNGGLENRQRVLKFNVKRNEWTRMPDLKIQRAVKHDCAFFKGGSKGDYVLVTGGALVNRMTELYYVPSGESKIVGNLNVGRADLSVVKVESPKQTIYAIGGSSKWGSWEQFEQDPGLDTVEEWDDASKTWKVTTIKLKRPNKKPASLAVPRDMICPK